LPVWEAQYVVVIASKTGWTEDFIRHRLPLARGWAYYHAARVLEGERCRWPGGGAAREYLSKVRRWWERFRHTKGKRA
jgi:hypothetical protein